jgi:hypothetical protein
MFSKELARIASRSKCLADHIGLGSPKNLSRRNNLRAMPDGVAHLGQRTQGVAGFDDGVISARADISLVVGCASGTKASAMVAVFRKRAASVIRLVR